MAIQSSSYAWYAELGHAAKFLPLLRSLRVEKECSVLLTPSLEGLKVSANLSQVAQRHIYIPRTLFVKWDEDNIRGGTGEKEKVALQFSIPLDHLIEAIEVCSASSGPSSKCRSIHKTGIVGLDWSKNTGRLTVRAVESSEEGTAISCSIATIETDGWSSQDWKLGDPICKLITSGQFLSQLLLQFQHFSVLRFEASPLEPVMRISAEDLLGSLSVNVPLKAGPLESYQCDDSVDGSFPTASLQHMYKIFALSSKVSFRIDGRGYLSIQLLIPFGLGLSIFYESLVMPLA